MSELSQVSPQSNTTKSTMQFSSTQCPSGTESPSILHKQPLQSLLQPPVLASQEPSKLVSTNSSKIGLLQTPEEHLPLGLKSPSSKISSHNAPSSHFQLSQPSEIYFRY